MKEQLKRSVDSPGLDNPGSALARVIELSEALSPSDRLSLWTHLSQPPDSGIESTDDVRPLIRDHWMRLGHGPSSSPVNQEKWEQVGFFSLKRKGNVIIASIDDAEVLRVTFKPAVFAEHLFQTLPMKPTTNELKERVRTVLQQAGANRSDADIEAALEQSARQVQDVVLDAKRNHVAARFTEKLPLIVGMILDNVIRAFAFEGSNMLFEQAGKGRRFSADEIQEMVFRHDWTHLKPMLAIRRGAPKGKRAVSRAERVAFVEKARAVTLTLGGKQKTIKKTDLARELFGRHANPLRELNRRLKKYEVDFRQLTN